MTEKFEVAKIRENTATGQMYVTIPKDSEFKPGQYVKIMKLD